MPGPRPPSPLDAYRNPRRNGLTLYDSVRQVDETVAAQFEGELYVIAVFGELHLGSGRLRFVALGHPQPLMMRRGKVIALTEGRRPLLGLTTPQLSVGEEHLQPGDWVVMHTDGVTEARERNGGMFGRRRLVDFLEREAAAGDPPAETVRRLIRVVVDRQGPATGPLVAPWTCREARGPGTVDGPSRGAARASLPGATPEVKDWQRRRPNGRGAGALRGPS